MLSQTDQVHTFTVAYPSLVNVLKTAIGVRYPIVNGAPVTEPGNDPLAMFKTNAIWDTGATNTAITRRAAEALHLKPVGQVITRGVHGERLANVYLVSITLPNNVSSAMMQVTECDALSGPDDQNQCDVLIGMDVIGTGDFAVTNFGGQTTMTFRIPSLEQIDFNVSSAHLTTTDSSMNQPVVKRPVQNGPSEREKIKKRREKEKKNRRNGRK